MVPARISLTLAFLGLFIWAGGALAKGAAPDESATSHHRYVHSHKSGSSKNTAQVGDPQGGGHHRHHAAASEPVAQASYTVVKDKHGRSRRVAHDQAANEPGHTRRTEQKRELIVVRDKHGRTHKVFRQVTVSRSAAERSHPETRRVAVMVRDKRGRLHKVYKNEVVQIPDESRPSLRERRGGLAKATASSSKKEEVKEETVAASHSQDSDSEPKGGDVPERMNPSFGKAYALYDEGANARISGNYPVAISCLGRALSMVPANSHGGPSVLQLNMEYELAQSAEASGDMVLAARYYSRALSDRPNFTEASVRLATVLARSGKYPEALRVARAATQRSPNDPRTHAILTVLLEKTGALEEAKFEKLKTKSLMANVHIIDTAPLVPPNTVINDAPPSLPNVDANNTAGESPQAGVQNMNSPAGNDSDATPVKKGSEKKDLAPKPGVDEELN